MFSDQFEIIENNKDHIQYRHIKIETEEFNRYIVKSIFDDQNLYKYVTNDIPEDNIEVFRQQYPIAQLINLIKDYKKEYIASFVSKDIKKKICKDKKAKYNGEIIDVTRDDWEEKFECYLKDNITGYDVIAEIILAKIIEEKFNADVFITKLATITSNNMKAFGIDTLNYNPETSTMFFGESKLTNDIDLGIREHEIDSILMEFKLNEECKLFALRGKTMRCKNEIAKEMVVFGKKMTIKKNFSLMELNKMDIPFNIALVYFIAHGDKYDYDYITEKISKFREKINFENITIYCITLPLKDKNDFKKKIDEVIKIYE